MRCRDDRARLVVIGDTALRLIVDSLEELNVFYSQFPLLLIFQSPSSLVLRIIYYSSLSFLYHMSCRRNTNRNITGSKSFGLHICSQGRYVFCIDYKNQILRNQVMRPAMTRAKRWRNEDRDIINNTKERCCQYQACNWNGAVVSLLFLSMRSMDSL